MTYKIEKLPEEEIYIATFDEPYNPIEDAGGIEKEMSAYMKKGEGTVYYIADLRKIEVSFSDLVMGLSEAFKMDVPTFYKDPRVKIIVVGDQQFVKFGTQAVKDQAQYGAIPIELFTSVDEAIEFAKQKS